MLETKIYQYLLDRGVQRNAAGQMASTIDKKYESEMDSLEKQLAISSKRNASLILWLEELKIEQKNLNNCLDECKEELQEAYEALELLLKAFDALLPGAKNIAVDIGLLNDAACKARPMVEFKGKEK